MLWIVWETYPPGLWKSDQLKGGLWIVWKTYPPHLWTSQWLILHLQSLWKTPPQKLWKSDCLEDRYVNSVENLSTGIVENSPVSHSYVHDVENLSTATVENFIWFLLVYGNMLKVRNSLHICGLPSFQHPPVVWRGVPRSGEGKWYVSRFAISCCSTGCSRLIQKKR